MTRRHFTLVASYWILMSNYKWSQKLLSHILFVSFYSLCQPRRRIVNVGRMWMINRHPMIAWQTLIWCDRLQPPASSSCSCVLALSDFESSGSERGGIQPEPPRCQIVHFIWRFLFLLRVGGLGASASFREPVWDQKLHWCRGRGFLHLILVLIWPPSKFRSRHELHLQGGTLDEAQMFARRVEPVVRLSGQYLPGEGCRVWLHQSEVGDWGRWAGGRSRLVDEDPEKQIIRTRTGQTAGKWITRMQKDETWITV